MEALEEVIIDESPVTGVFTMTDIAPAEQFQQDNTHLWGTYERFQWLLRQRNNNGLVEAGAVLQLKPRGRIYVHIPNFKQWLVNRSIEGNV